MSQLSTVTSAAVYGAGYFLAHDRRLMREGPNQTNNDFPSIRFQTQQDTAWNLVMAVASVAAVNENITLHIGIAGGEFLAFDKTGFILFQPAAPIPIPMGISLEIWGSAVDNPGPIPTNEYWSVSAIVSASTRTGAPADLTPYITRFLVNLDKPHLIQPGVPLVPQVPVVSVILQDPS